MSGFIEAAMVGAIIGGGTAAATGGDPKKGAMRGAIAGPVGGAIAGPGLSAGTAGTTAMVAGATAVKKAGKSPATLSRDPVAKTVLASERAQSVTDQLKKRKQYRTAMGGGYGGLTLGTPGLLGA